MQNVCSYVRSYEYFKIALVGYVADVTHILPLLSSNVTERKGLCEQQSFNFKHISS